MTQLPLTTSGKLDRKTLREIGSGLSATQIAAFSLAPAEKVPLSTRLQTDIAVLWANLLEIPVADMEPTAISSN